ncbi:MAG: hypothetical protein EPO08_12375 [Rhodospirillaceae bacterium]|nr:MAG: hypothetical protein EPO08_12375 [Rhodospirillaceae bacterium]
MKLRRLGWPSVRSSALGCGVMTSGARTAEDDTFRQLNVAFDTSLDTVIDGMACDIRYLTNNQKTQNTPRANPDLISEASTSSRLSRCPRAGSDH